MCKPHTHTHTYTCNEAPSLIHTCTHIHTRPYAYISYQRLQQLLDISETTSFIPLRPEINPIYPQIPHTYPRHMIHKSTNSHPYYPITYPVRNAASCCVVTVYGLTIALCMFVGIIIIVYSKAPYLTCFASLPLLCTRTVVVFTNHSYLSTYIPCD